MRYFIEPQDIGNFRYIPLRLLQQDLRFFGNTTVHDFGGASAGGFFQYFVQVINMNAQAICKISRCFQLDRLRHIFNGKLSFEQFNKQR